MLTKTLWQKHLEEDIWLFTLSGNNTTLQVSNLGCSIVSLRVNKDNISRNIILGYETAREYLQDRYYVGSLVGRFAGRIAGAAFRIGARRYTLSTNEEDTGNHLHGGFSGFNKKVFTVTRAYADADRAVVTLRRKSPHLEEGYPGNLHLDVAISLNALDEVSITYEASADRPTHVNLTHHCYFNLTGRDDALGQQLKISAARMLQYGRNYIPTGRVVATAGTSYDFTAPRNLHGSPDALGYNDYFIFHNSNLQTTQAELADPQSGLKLKLHTSYPGVLLYTGDYLGAPFKKNQGICLETQLYPDAPNRTGFPPSLLNPGEKYHHETVISIHNIQ